MKHLSKLLFVGVLAAFLSLSLVASQVSAQEKPVAPKNFEDIKKVQQEAKEKAQEIRQNIDEKKEDPFMDRTQESQEGMPKPEAGPRCEALTKKIKSVRGGFDKNHQFQIKKYAAIIARLTKIEASFSEKGYDTTALSAGIETMKEIALELQTNFDTFTTELEKTQGAECGTEDMEFTTAFQNSRSALLIVREDIMTMQEHYNSVIRPELKNLITQVELDEEAQSEASKEADTDGMEMQESNLR